MTLDSFSFLDIIRIHLRPILPLVHRDEFVTFVIGVFSPASSEPPWYSVSYLPVAKLCCWGR